MDSIKTIIIIILVVSLSISVFSNIYYALNIKNIKNQLKEIMNKEDTNQLLTVMTSQRNILELVNTLNNMIKNIRVSEIEIRRINQSFRQSIINISHDLRTPLTTAGGYLQMLQSGVSKEEEKEYLSIISERQNMVKVLLEQLFEYVRIESGEIVYEKEPIEAKKIFIDTLAMYYDDFNKKGEEPRIEVPEKPCMVIGDEKGIKRIFSNILYNSIIHGKGGYSFKIYESKGYVFTFSNVSEEMTSEDLNNIFHRFYTKDNWRNKKTTGLGLSIAKEITRRMGGEIKAQYNKDIFTIYVVLPKNKTS
ncbi:sensor histidine kinase [Haloimpatiens sp. FM7315]|uniref:sensor histidine kinase n=1 Tax=Haloimpatiens sp. FM7315 TaxID=3298609 RepID=UPI0035A3330B